MWDKITYPLPNFNSATEVWNGYFSHTYLGMWLVIHGEIKVNPYYQTSPR